MAIAHFALEEQKIKSKKKRKKNLKNMKKVPSNAELPQTKRDVNLPGTSQHATCVRKAPGNTLTCTP